MTTKKPGDVAAAPVLAVQNLHVSYYGTPALTDVSFTLPMGTPDDGEATAQPPGRLTAVLGPNGAGKSTLMKAILGLVPISAGKIELFGAAPKVGRRKVAYVPQRGEVDWTFPITVGQTAELGTYPRLRTFQRVGAEQRRWAAHCLELVGLSDLAGRQIGELSGGQQQRLFIARALAQRAEAVLLDEPFAGIDAASERVIVGVLHDLRAQGVHVIAVHHELSTAAQYFDDAILLDTNLVAAGVVEQVLAPATLARAYRFPTVNE